MITQPNPSIPHHTQERNSVATSTSSHLSGSTRYEDSRRPSEYGHSESSSRKRSRADDFQSSTQESPIYNTHLNLNIPTIMSSNGPQSSNQISPFQFRAPQLPQGSSTDRSPVSDTHQLQLQQAYNPDKALNTNQHHHHHLPPHSPTLKRTRQGEDELLNDPGPPSMVGKEGMPEPAPRPKGPKLKFTREDDALLVRLKESKNLTWKQIAEFFPGRSAGTLQVRYCTKLKAKTTLWNDDMVSDAFSFPSQHWPLDSTTGLHGQLEIDMDLASRGCPKCVLLEMMLNMPAKARTSGNRVRVYEHWSTVAPKGSPRTGRQAVQLVAIICIFICLASANVLESDLSRRIIVTCNAHGRAR